MSSLSLSNLHPHCIEICRRIRLVWRNDRIAALTSTSKKPRIAAKDAKGNVGDHWTPVALDGKALSISRVGFRYDRLAKLILERGAYEHPAAMFINDGDVRAGRAWRLVARGVAAGQGKTEGYHERSDIEFGPAVTKTLLTLGPRRDRLEDFAKEQLKEIENVSKALRFAISIAASGGKDASNLSKSDREKAHPYMRRLDTIADNYFFGALQERFEASDEDRENVQRSFVRMLIMQAKDLLQEAVDTVPCTRIQRYRARARAMSAYWGRLRRFFNLTEILGKTRLEEQDVP